jgi:23S rRNA (cytosine1962-C5)-methyltransferase
MSSPAVLISSRAIDRILSGHPWIYRADVKPSQGIEPGSIVTLMDQRMHFWGQALYSDKSEIALRLLTRERKPVDRAFIAERIAAAAEFRREIVGNAQAYRLVSSEGDLLPSLVIDRYDDCLVVQTLSQGMERLKPTIVEILQEQFNPRAILERNDASVRALEGLAEQTGVLAGEDVREVAVEENGLKFWCDLRQGQKTGGFLDQRENRAAAQVYAKGRTLDCFTYGGAFALTVAHKCRSVLGIDISGEAIALAKRNQELNACANVDWREANCFDFLKSADQGRERFETIILDPPAFARQKANVEPAMRGYKELNLRALKMLAPRGVLITCVCSYHVNEADLLACVASAALDAHRTVVVLERRTQSRDHPILLTVPETLYLKCLILRAMS